MPDEQPVLIDEEPVGARWFIHYYGAASDRRRRVAAESIAEATARIRRRRPDSLVRIVTKTPKGEREDRGSDGIAEHGASGARTGLAVNDDARADGGVTPPARAAPHETASDSESRGRSQINDLIGEVVHHGSRGRQRVQEQLLVQRGRRRRRPEIERAGVGVGVAPVPVDRDTRHRANGNDDDVRGIKEGSEKRNTGAGQPEGAAAARIGLRVHHRLEQTGSETVTSIGEDLIKTLTEGRSRSEKAGTTVVLWHRSTSWNGEVERTDTERRRRVPETDGQQGAKPRVGRPPPQEDETAGGETTGSRRRKTQPEGRETMNDETREKVARMTKALQECLTVLESSGMKNVMQISQVHGFPYAGPKVDIPTLKTAIADGEELTS